MLGIRQKLLLGFGGVMVIILGIGILTIIQLGTLGRAIDVILRENYRSVVACQRMKEALERIDSGVMFTLAGKQAAGMQMAEENLRNFRTALDVENGNITLPGEGEQAQRLEAQFGNYQRALPLATDAGRPMERRQAAYFATLLPLFNSIKSTAQAILDMNQANMSAANDAARREAATASRRMGEAILVCLAIVVLFMALTQRWITSPLKRLTESAEEIRNGNLDLVLTTSSSDEVGRLCRAFNDMTEALRLARRTEQRNLMRTRNATEEVFKALPAAIALLDPEGRVETATETAHKYFGLVPGVRVKDLGYEWLTSLVELALDGRTAEPATGRGYLQQFIGGQEYFFQPSVHPIPDGVRRSEPAGVAVILKDVTEVRQQAELKRGVVATVSHQLKTPLTSLRMSLHLLLDDKLGPLNSRQTELALAARDESERLTVILDDLLDPDRMEGDGAAYLRLQAVSPHMLVRDGMQAFLTEAKVKGVTIINAVPEDLPGVQADPSRISHVFSNLISNALRFLEPGGVVAMRGIGEKDAVRFEVEDTGKGIPAEYLPRVFEPFFRAPGQEASTGAGLGLAIVKDIVEAHGGTVGVENAPSRGAIFWFTLPWAGRSPTGMPDPGPKGSGKEARSL